MRYLSGEIASITGADLTGPDDHLVTHIKYDSRRMDEATGALFIALTGPNHDGHNYLEDVLESGIKVILVNSMPPNVPVGDDISILRHADPLTALQNLASHHSSKMKALKIAITGSNGKTQVKEWLSLILESMAPTAKSPGSFNSQLGVPLSVLGINMLDEWALIEAGISKPGEMKHLWNIIKPDFGLFTNIGDAHQENFISLQQKIAEKFDLFRDAKRIYYCLDQKPVAKHAQTLTGITISVTWSAEQNADLQVIWQETKDNQTGLKAIFRGQPVSIILPFADKASIENLILIWLFCLDQGFDSATIQEIVSQLEPLAMRLEQKAGVNDCTLINDYYNSDIQSLKVALDLLFQQTPQQKKTIILSDILQSGVPPEQLYGSISMLLKNRHISRIIGIGPTISNHAHLFTQEILTFPSTRAFLATMNPDDFRNEAILLKGARKFSFELISRSLEERVHNTVLEIRMHDLRNNLNEFRRIIPRTTKLMVMVKAFSYGSGGYEIARFIANEKVDYLGVAIIDEGIELRQAGVKSPIMVMNPDLQQVDLLSEFNLEPEVFNLSGLLSLKKEINRLGINKFPVHLKIDTGMHRLGFEPKDVPVLLKHLAGNEDLFIKSVFSHLASSDEPDGDDFSHQQILTFLEVCNELEKGFGYPFIRHIVNTSGIIRFPDAHFDMVRLGIGLYGFGEAENLNLKPIMTMKSRILQIRQLKKGEHIGYGSRSILEKDTTVAIIPAGYADGIDRRLGNGNFNMMVNGLPAKTVGNISMDMTCLDVSGIPVKEGDEVVIMGHEIPIKQVASKLNTIPYEILTSIPLRVKRVYLFE